MGWFGRRSGKREIGDIETTIGRSTTFSGELKVDGGLRIDGRFDGTLEVGGNVVIGERGRVVADIDAGHVTVGGKVQGNIRAAGRLEILSTGQVLGDILAGQVIIDPGGVLQGMSLMGDASSPALAAPAESVRDLQLMAEDDVVDAEVIDQIIEGRAAAVEQAPEEESRQANAPETRAEAQREDAASEPSAPAAPPSEADGISTAFAKPKAAKIETADEIRASGAEPKPRSQRRVGGLGRGLDLSALDIEPVIPDLGGTSSSDEPDDGDRATADRGSAGTKPEGKPPRTPNARKARGRTPRSKKGR